MDNKEFETFGSDKNWREGIEDLAVCFLMNFMEAPKTISVDKDTYFKMISNFKLTADGSEYSFPPTQVVPEYIEVETSGGPVRIVCDNPTDIMKLLYQK